MEDSTAGSWVVKWVVRWAAAKVDHWVVLMVET